MTTRAAAERNATAQPKDQEFVISRTFDAPRDLVWKAFTEPARMQQWWGPKGFTVIAAKMDLRPGGTFHYGMRAPDGSAMWGKFVYREIVRPERIVLVNSFSDEAGNVTRHPLHASWPLRLLSTFLFTEEDGRTTLTIRWTPLDADETERATFAGGHASMQQGWTGTLDQLAAYLAKAEAAGSRTVAANTSAAVKPTVRSVEIRRVFDAPRTLVFRAWTDPEHVAQWWGPHGFTTRVRELDPRPGGAIHLIMRGPDGSDYPMAGTFREVSPPKRLVFAATAGDGDGTAALETVTTVTFAEHGGKTKLTLHARAIGFIPAAARMLDGMHAGWTQSLERLEALVSGRQPTTGAGGSQPASRA